MSSDDSKFDFDDDIFRDKRHDDQDDEKGKDSSYPPEGPEDYDEEEDEEINPEDDFFTDADFEFKDYGADYDESGARSKRTKQKIKRRRLIISTVVIMIILVGIAIGIVFGYRWIKNRFFSSGEVAEEGAIAVPASLELGQDISIVISGAGENLLEPELNSIIFSRYESAEKSLTSLTMPATTLMEIPGFGLDSVDRSVEFGGMDLLKLTLKDNIGMDVNNYMLIDIFNTVNTLEGINLELTSPLSFTTANGDLVELEQGPNIINGETAISFLNYYSGLVENITSQDTQLQKLVMDTIIGKIVGTEEGELAENLSRVSGFIETDLNLEELSKVLSTFSNIPEDNDRTFGLDITPVELEGNMFYVPDITRVADIFDTEAAIEQEAAVQTKTVSVTVLNGVGTPGIAGNTSELLKAVKFDNGLNKFDVENIGDADNYNYETTQIILGSGDAHVMSAAEDIKSLLKAGNIVAQEGSDLATEIVIILGSDYDYEAASAGLTGTAPEGEETVTQPVTSLVRVNVLNGEGTAGLAGTVGDILLEYFNETAEVIDIIEVKDADNWNYTQTEIRVFSDEQGVEQVAQQIKDVLSVGIIEKSDDNVDNVDISIVLGSDYTNN